MSRELNWYERYLAYGDLWWVSLLIIVAISLAIGIPMQIWWNQNLR